MSNLITHDQSQTTTEAPKQTPEVLNDVGKGPKNKKFSMPKIDISKIVLLFQRHGILITLNFVILGVVCVLFLFQRHWIKGGNNDMIRMVEEKVKESLKKNVDLDGDITKATRQEKMKEDKLSKQKNSMEKMGSKNESNTAHIDSSKFIIEANRVYEQGDYERAAVLYEKGLDKSMPFLNEDFAMYRLGDCYLRSEKYDEALKVFQTLNNDYINSPYQFKSRLKASECYAGMGEFKKARKMLYTIIAQEGKCCSEDDQATVVDSYFKIADYYMDEAQRLRKTAKVETSNTTRSSASK